MVKIKLQWLLLLLAMSVSGFAHSEQTKIIKTSPFCRDVMKAIGTTPEQAIQRFGKPLSHEEKDMKNTHSEEGVVDKIVILKYQSSRIGFLFSGHTQHYLLLGAELTSRNFGRELAAIIPINRGAALAKLGQPEGEQENPNTLRYFCTSDLMEWVDLVFNANSQQTTGIIFTSHID